MADWLEPIGGDKYKLWKDLGSNTFAEAMSQVSSTGTAAGTITNPNNVITRSIRNSGVLHRSAVVAADKLSVPTAVTVADVATGGSLAFNTTYNATIAANTVFGPTTVPTVGSVTTANDAAGTHVARVTTAQVTNAVSYDVFLSTDAAPKWVARVTEAQRAAGVTITAVGTVNATSPGANKIDVRVVGTGVASNVAPFASNNAFDITGITPVDCTGYSTAVVQAILSYTDLRTAPTFNLIVLGKDASGTIYTPFVFTQPSTPLNGARQILAAGILIPVAGTTGLLVLVDAITGQGASANIYVDLA